MENSVRLSILKKYWFPICSSKEIKVNRPQRVYLFNLPLLIWKTKQSKFNCLEDRCPHRGFPLSKGKIDSNNHIQCPYHGWTFDDLGHCSSIPAEGKINCKSNICIQAFSIKESEGLLWVKAHDFNSEYTKDFLPPSFKSDRIKGLRFSFKQQEIEASFQEVVENFMDSAHTPFVHNGLIRRRSEPRLRRVQIEKKFDSVKLFHEPTDEKVGVFNKYFNPHDEPIMHTDSFKLPGVIEVQYMYGKTEVFKSYIYCVFRKENKTTAYIYLGLNFGKANKILSVFLKLLAQIVIWQDLKTLRTLNKNKRYFKDQKDIFLKSDLGLKYVSEIVKNFMSDVKDTDEKQDTIKLWV